MAARSHFEHKIGSFFDSLTEERETFRLPLSQLLQYQVLVTEEENQEIVGIAGLRKRNALFVVVKASYQNRGIGQKLTNKVIDEAKRRNYFCITLNVFQSNVKAIRIYQKSGFRTVYSSLIEGQPNHFMVLPLNWVGTIFMMKFKLSAVFSKITKQRARGRNK